MAANAYLPSTAAMLKAFWTAISVADPEGEVQQAKDGTPLPTPTYATTKTSP